MFLFCKASFKRTYRRQHREKESEMLALQWVRWRLSFLSCHFIIPMPWWWHEDEVINKSLNVETITALVHASDTKFALQMMLWLFNILAGLQHIRNIRKVFNVLFSTVLHSWEEHYALPSDKWLVLLIRSGIWDSWNALTFSSNRFCLCSQIISGWSFLYDN